MSKIKETKEEILTKLAKLEQSYENLLKQDERLRREFSVILGFMKPRQEEFRFITINEAPTIPLTWERIFTEIGKLLSARNFYDFEGNVSELEFKLEELQNKVSQNIEKKV